jgi:hypothetical protein
MFLRPKHLYLTAALALALPALSFSASTGIQVTVNGTPTCESGSCDSPTLAASAITYLGTPSTGAFNFNVTLADGDMYNVAGSFANSFPSGANVGFYPTVTYIGASPSVASDLITLDMFQDFFFHPGIDWNSPPNFTESIPFVLSGAGESGSGHLSWDGIALPTLSTGIQSTQAGTVYLNGSKSITTIVNDTLVGDYTLNFDFSKGIKDGAFIGSPSPEPAQTIPVAIGLLGLLAFKVRRFRSGSVK